MLKRTLFLALFALQIACTSHASEPLFPRTVTDARGAKVFIAAAPRRLISLSPGTTEMLYALGLGNRVVGDTVYCDYPAAAQKVSKIGDVNPNYEKIVSLRPDLIIVDIVASPGAAGRLTQLHLPFFAVRPDSLTTAEESLMQLGRATGTERNAQRTIRVMQSKERAADKIVRDDPLHHPKVLAVVEVAPLWTAGSGTFIGSLIQRAGAINIGSVIKNYGSISKEAVIANPPDVILAGPQEQSAFRQDPALRTLAATRAHRFISLRNSEALVRPGPRLADALLELTQALHPGVK